MNFGSFKFLTGDVNYVDYGGKWYRKIGTGRYHVLTLDTWEELDSSAVELYGKYNVTLSEVDLAKLATPRALEGNPPRFRLVGEQCFTPLDGSLRSYGWEYRQGEGITDQYGVVCGFELNARGERSIELVMLEACHGCGAKAPLWEESGNNYLRLIREARRYSRKLTQDAALHRDALDSPVNQIGTSAENYMLGKIWRSA